MSQHDFDIANQTASNTRVDLNLALKALASQSSGTSAPTTTYANMMWYDTTNNILYMRNEADSSWINIGVLNQTSNTFAASGVTNAAVIAGLGFTPVQQGGGVGQLNNKIFLGWDGGGLRLQVDDNSGFGRIALQSEIMGIGQTWQGVSRSLNTSYLNSTGKPIHVSAARGGMPLYFEVSQNNSSWLRIASAEISGGAMIITHTAIIPNGYYYRVVGGSGNPDVKELR